MGVVELEPVDVKVAQEEKELLAEGQGEAVCVSLCTALTLLAPLPL